MLYLFYYMYKSSWVWSSFHPHAYVKWRCQCELFRSFFIKEGASTEKECWHIRYLKESAVTVMDTVTVDVTESANEEDHFTENITDFESAEDTPPVPEKRSLSHQFDAISQAVAAVSAEKNILVTRNNTIYGT
jgi:hypothetical protein